MMVIKQYFDIKYPFTNDCIEKYEFDLNKSEKEKVASELLHLIFTPKGQRIRKPDFGTRLIQFIFNPNDSTSFSDVVSEIKESVKMWIPDCNIKDVDVAEAENGLQLFARIQYTLTELDGSTGNYEIISKL